MGIPEKIENLISLKEECNISSLSLPETGHYSFT